jgi:hypothetical protein
MVERICMRDGQEQERRCDTAGKSVSKESRNKRSPADNNGQEEATRMELVATRTAVVLRLHILDAGWVEDVGTEGWDAAAAAAATGKRR